MRSTAGAGPSALFALAFAGCILAAASQAIQPPVPPVQQQTAARPISKWTFTLGALKSNQKNRVINEVLAANPDVNIEEIARKYSQVALAITDAAYNPTKYFGKINDLQFEAGEKARCPGLRFTSFDRIENATSHCAYASVSVESEKLALLGFRGTTNLQDVMTDLNSMPIDYKFGSDSCGRMHRGMYGMLQSALSNVRARVASWMMQDRFDTYIFAGHSLGAGIAQMCAVEMVREFPQLAKKLVVITYGQPNIGNLDYVKCAATHVPRSISLEIDIDPITKVPADAFSCGYEFSLPCALMSPLNCHRTGSYRDAVEKRFGNGVCATIQSQQVKSTS